jgi:hypothetical protein
MVTKNMSEKGPDPLQRGPKTNEIASPLKGQHSFRIVSSMTGRDSVHDMSRRRGGMTILLLFMLVGILTVGAFAIGLGQIQLVRREAQIVADYASISGAYLFGEKHPGDFENPEKMAAAIPIRNTIFGRQGRVNPNDIVLGRVVFNGEDGPTFRPGSDAANAIRVTIGLGKDRAMPAPNLLFPFLLDINSFALEQTSVSAKLAQDIVLVMDRSVSML